MNVRVQRYSLDDSVNGTDVCDTVLSGFKGMIRKDTGASQSSKSISGTSAKI